jgi:hypothetical protein
LPKMSSQPSDKHSNSGNVTLVKIGREGSERFWGTGRLKKSVTLISRFVKIKISNF